MTYASRRLNATPHLIKYTTILGRSDQFTILSLAVVLDTILICFYVGMATSPSHPDEHDTSTCSVRRVSAATTAVSDDQYADIHTVSPTTSEGIPSSDVVEKKRPFLTRFQSRPDRSTESALDLGLGMVSCPELPRDDDDVASFKWPKSKASRRVHPGRGSRSQPPTPKSLRERLATRFRFARPWDSARGSLSSVSQVADLPRIQPGKERRRLARESKDHECSSGAGSSLQASPLEGEGTDSLAVAGIVLATQDLDRLTMMAGERTQGMFRDTPPAA